MNRNARLAAVDNALFEYLETVLFADPAARTRLSLIVSDFRRWLPEGERVAWTPGRIERELSSNLVTVMENSRPVRYVTGYTTRDPAEAALAAKAEATRAAEAAKEAKRHSKEAAKHAAEEAKRLAAESAAAEEAARQQAAAESAAKLEADQQREAARVRNERLMEIHKRTGFLASTFDRYVEYAPGSYIAVAEIIAKFGGRAAVEDVQYVLAIGDSLPDYRWTPCMLRADGSLKSQWYENDDGSFVPLASEGRTIYPADHPETLTDPVRVAWLARDRAYRDRPRMVRGS